MSGLSHHPGKVAQGLPCREFESLSLRQVLCIEAPYGAFLFFVCHFVCQLILA